MFQDINQAIAKASVLHEGQKRRGIPLPYLVHPYAVASMLAFYVSDKDAIVAALMHDTVEDTEYTFSDLERDFWARVKQIVGEVTEHDVALEGRSIWQARKQGYLVGLKKASFEGVAVSWADKMHNLMSFAESYDECGDDFLKSFSAPPLQILWFLRSCKKFIKKDYLVKCLLSIARH